MKVLKWLDNNLEQAILLILLCGMTIVMGGQIIARYAFSASLSWSEEITRYMFIISGFISASYCIKHGLSVKIDQLVGMLPGKGVHYMRLVSYLIQLLFFAYLVPFAWKYVKAGMASGQLSPACGIPMYLIQSFTVISFVIAIPISVSLGLVAVLPGVFDPSFTASASYVIRSMFGGIDSFPLLAVPMFILSGIIMARGGISKRLFDLFSFFIGKRTAGLPCAAVITCLFYGAISGSGIATVAAVGSMTIPLLVELGYDKKFCTALVAVAGSLGVIIPPSIPFIMYGMASGASVSDIFLAGIVPGVLIGLLLMVYAVFYCKKHGEDKEKINAKIDALHEQGLWKVFKSSFFAVLSPVIILGCIYSGVASPTEAAVISVFYSLIVSIFIYKSLPIKKVYDVFVEAVRTYAPILFILAASIAFSRVLTLMQVPQLISGWILAHFTSKVVVLIVINLVLLLVGMVMDTTPAILILTPILLPIVEGFGMNPIHFGVMMVVNLAIGFVTPPIGVNLFVASSLTDIPVVDIAKRAMPLIGFFLIALLLITFIPQISLCLL